VSPTQVARSAKARESLLEAAAEKLSRYGYANLVLERVAAEAGYTRGAVYHHFEDKQELALAVLARETDAWEEEVGALADQQSDPVTALIALVRAHAAYFHRESARVGMTMRVEFGPREHPVGRAADRNFEALVERCARLIAAARLRGTISSGPPARTLARALIGAVEGASIQLAGQADRATVAENVARGVLDLPRD
jgi:AcrR family transcriptional regulator